MGDFAAEVQKILRFRHPEVLAAIAASLEGWPQTRSLLSFETPRRGAALRMTFEGELPGETALNLQRIS
jgi:hypothetical protein